MANTYHNGRAVEIRKQRLPLSATNSNSVLLVYQIPSVTSILNIYFHE